MCGACWQAVDGHDSSSTSSLIQRHHHLHRNHSYDDLSAASHLATPMVGSTACLSVSSLSLCFLSDCHIGSVVVG